MNLKNIVLFSMCLILAGCGEEKAKRYVFDIEEIRNNTSQYVKSSGPMDELGCGMMSLLFSQELQEDLKAGKEPDILSYGDNLRPAEIKVSDNEVEWLTLGLKNKIQDGKITANFGKDAETIDLTIAEKTNEKLIFNFRDKDLECDMPFKLAQ